MMEAAYALNNPQVTRATFAIRIDVAQEKRYVKPSIYQGQYKLLCRTHEKPLFPLLRQNRMSFAAYSPLAGGFLLGNLTKDGVQGGSRFSVQTPFTKWYDHDSMHDAISKLRKISEQSGLSMDELSLRWLKHHSILQEQDIIIMGAGKTKQITGSVEKMTKGPLDSQVVRSLEDLCAGVEQDAAAIVDFELKP